MAKVPGAAYARSLQTKITFTPNEINLMLRILSAYQENAANPDLPSVRVLIGKINKALVK